MYLWQESDSLAPRRNLRIHEQDRGGGIKNKGTRVPFGNTSSRDVRVRRISSGCGGMRMHCSTSP